jgi:hypothetical protein
MELYLSCDDFTFKVTPMFWLVIRKEFVNASFRLLQNEIEKKTKQFFSIDLVDKYILSNSLNSINDFIIMSRNKDIHNIYTYNCIDGVIILLEKSDFDGYYSIGNAYDILETINNLKPFINDEITLKHLPFLKILFQKSIDKKRLVTIERKN